MKISKMHKRVIAAVSAALVCGAALAVQDPNVVSASTAVQTSFTENFPLVSNVYVQISVVVTLVGMAVRWFRKGAK